MWPDLPCAQKYVKEWPCGPDFLSFGQLFYMLLNFGFLGQPTWSPKVHKMMDSLAVPIDLGVHSPLCGGP